MCYPDWLLNGSDAWVAVLGAPMRSPKDFKVSRTLSSASLGDVASGRSCWSWNSSTTGAATSSSTGKADPWAEENAYLYSVVLGNEGRPLNRLVDVADAESALREVVLGLLSANLLEVAKALPKEQPPKLVVYAHRGSTTKTRRSIKFDDWLRTSKPIVSIRSSSLGRPGFWESISNILSDTVRQFVSEPQRPPAACLTTSSSG